MSRRYTLDQYRRDLAALELRRHDGPALRRLLDEAVTADLDLDPAEDAIPLSRVVARALPTPPRPTLSGLGSAPVSGRWPSTVRLLAELDRDGPVTYRVLAAVGLGSRPSGRQR